MNLSSCHSELLIDDDDSGDYDNDDNDDDDDDDNDDDDYDSDDYDEVGDYGAKQRTK